MTRPEFIAAAAAMAGQLSAEQRALVTNVMAALAENGGVDLVGADRRRRERERQWEEQQLRGPELARRRREPT